VKQVGNTILAKGGNHILAKRDNSAWPKGSKLSGFSKYLAVLTQSPVFVDNPLSDVKQADIGNHARFLTVDVNPLMVVEVGSDIFLCEIAHIGEGQARECAKQI